MPSLTLFLAFLPINSERRNYKSVEVKVKKKKKTIRITILKCIRKSTQGSKKRASKIRA